MTKYPLEICTLVDLDGGGTTCYYSKGHHNCQEFIDEALKEHDVVIKSEDVRFVYMRWEFCAGPDGPTHCGEEHYLPGRGKFPVTIAHKWEAWDD